MTPQYGIHQDHVDYALDGDATNTKYSTAPIAKEYVKNQRGGGAISHPNSTRISACAALIPDFPCSST